jgi:hypothetical protein
MKRMYETKSQQNNIQTRASTFSKNKEILLENEVAIKFLVAVPEQARRRKLLSEDHFTVDATLLEAYASLKSFHPIDGNAIRVTIPIPCD